MIHCKKHLIVAGFALMLPLVGWAEAPVVDGGDDFAIEQRARLASVAHSKYDDRDPGYFLDQADDEQALVREDPVHDSNAVLDSAKLIDKVQSLQQEIQELRGQLEVQAHDLKLLQQQQMAFYKDLDSRLSSAGLSKKASNQSSLSLSVAETPSKIVPSTPNNTLPSLPPASKANPADEQISYLAAYELVKNKQFDEAIKSMSIFIQKYPSGGYTANAYYWLGELYLAKKNYPQAIEHFNRVLQQFPLSNKSAASMLKIGYAYAAHGNKQEAKKFLQQVVTAYPTTSIAELARAKLRTI